MDIEKEKSAFLGIYKYYPSAIKFTFDVENECFVLSKKNPLDHEVEVMSQMNQQWQAWFRRAKLEYEKLNGCVVVPKGQTEDWYLDPDEHIWYEQDGIDYALSYMDIGEVTAIEHKEYLITESDTLYAAIVWDDSNDQVGFWEFFKTEEEAENAAAHCKAMREAAKECE